MIEREYFDKVVLLRMAYGKVNAMDIKFCEAVRAEFEAEKETDSRAVVLTGSGSIFSAGVDLRRVLKEEKTYTMHFLEAFAAMLLEVLRFPKPTIAAINGHAIAGGCILACTCDERIMAASAGRIGLPELLVGVPFPELAIQILQNAIPSQSLPHLIYSGALLSAEQAQKHHLVNEVAPEEQLLERAKTKAQQYAALAPAAFGRTKSALQASLPKPGQSVERDVVAMWMADETRERIRIYMENAGKKK